MAYHAKLSPSGADRWSTCFGSVVLAEGVEDPGSDYAAWGTAAHALAAHCLDRQIPPADLLGAVFEGFAADDEMVACVADYIGFVQRLTVDADLVMYERAVPISHLTGEPDATGTADVIAVRGKEIIIIDLKTGFNVVEAERNKQMLMYASGAIRLFDMACEFETVTLAISMPRAYGSSVWSCSVVDAAIELVEISEAAQRINDGDTTLTPSDKACRYCRVKGACPALKEKAMAVARIDDFENLDKRIALLTNDQLADIAPKLDLVEGWCGGVRAELERRLKEGQSIPGLKLVAGKKGNRAWTDETAAAQLLETTLGDKAFTKKLISPSQAEKLMKDGFEPFKTLVTQAEGKPTVVPASDKRPAILTALDFQTLEHHE